MPIINELTGETQFETSLFTGFATSNPYEIFEPRPCMELMERRIQENIQETCCDCKKISTRSKMIETRNAIILNGYLLQSRRYCSKICKLNGEAILENRAFCMN